MLNRMDRLVGSYGFFGADNCISYDDTAELAGGDFAEVVLAKGFLPGAPEQPGIVKATSWVDGVILEAHGKSSVDGANMGRVAPNVRRVESRAAMSDLSKIRHDTAVGQRDGVVAELAANASVPISLWRVITEGVTAVREVQIIDEAVCSQRRKYII